MSNFTHLSLDELLKSRDEIDRLIVQRRKEAKDNLLSEFRQKAESLGLDFEELVGTSTKKRSTPKRAVKYRNPDNESQTWTGTGRKPKWVIEQLATGRTLDDLTIR